MNVRKILIFWLFSIVATCSAKELNQMQYVTKGNSTIVENLNNKGKHICTDNIRLINNTSTTLTFDAFGITGNTEKKLTSITVKNNDTKLRFLDEELELFDQVKLICINGNVEISKVISKNNDMYFYIDSFTPQNSNKQESDNITKDNKSTQTEPGIPYENFHFTYDKTISNTKYAFGNAKIWIAEAFGSAKFVIQIEDRETGTIVGKGLYNDVFQELHFTFKIKIRDNIAKIEFYDFYITSLTFGITEKLKPNTQKEFDFCNSLSESLSKSFFTTLETE